MKAIHVWFFSDDIGYYSLCDDIVGHCESGYAILDDII